MWGKIYSNFMMKLVMALEDLPFKVKGFPDSSESSQISLDRTLIIVRYNF